MPEVAHASTNSSAVTYSARLRRLCSPTRANAKAVTAPSAPASPANAPNCTAHFVGVNVSSNSPTAVRADQPPHRPVDARRARCRAATAPRSARTGTAAGSAPRSGGSATRRRCPRRSGSSSAGIPGTRGSSDRRLYLMRADSATVASVWSRNMMTKTSDSGREQRSQLRGPPVGGPARGDHPRDGASGDQQRRQRDQALRCQGHREHRDRRSRPRRATADGCRRCVRPASTPRSPPKAISGSGSQPVVERQPGRQEHRARGPHRDPVARPAACPSRGSTHRLRISQVPIAAAVAGSRIQTPAVLTDARCASTL